MAPTTHPSLRHEGIDVRFVVKHADFKLDVDLRLPGRGVTGLFGHSGSGKTTWLRCMAGLVKPDEGYLRIDGQTWLDTANQIDLPTYRRPLGYVFQEPSLFSHMNVLRNLQFGQKRIPVTDRRVDLDRAVSLLGIDHLLEREPDSLSGGERQRVGIARALLTSPRLLLMDEPLAALDLKRKREILPYLQRLHDELDIPIIYVSHSPDEMARLADHLVMLDNGRVVTSGPVGEILTRLDLSIARSDEASVMIEGTACAYDPDYGLLSVRLGRKGVDVKDGSGNNNNNNNNNNNSGSGSGTATDTSDNPDDTSVLRMVHPPIAIGESVRLTVQARDISLTTDANTVGSILNRLAVKVLAMASAEDPNHVIVRLDSNGTHLLARITRYSCDKLALTIGSTLYAQIKAISLLR